MSLDNALTSAMQTVPECLGAAYVDMDSGMLLAVKTVDTHPQPVLDMVAAATADMFQGPTVSEIEGHFRHSRNSTGNHHYFQEFLVFSENLVHVFLRSKKFDNHAICYVCRKSANVGMVLTKSRMSVERLEDHV